MRKLIESTHVSLGGEIGSPQDWAFPYLDDEHMQYAITWFGLAIAVIIAFVVWLRGVRRTKVSNQS